MTSEGVTAFENYVEALQSYMKL
ncbi:MAG: hypothetical protein M3Z26_14945 [Bacteroidota bacterium]|nr:hypothetical protein [Bacteroidota bacterium]